MLRMAAPLTVSFVMRAAFTLVDTIYAATLGDAAVAAIGLAIPFEFLMIALWVGISTGLTSRLAHALGAKEAKKLAQYLSVSRRLVALLVPTFLAVGGGVWLLAPRMGLEPDVWRAFQVYGAVVIGGSAFTSFWSIIPDSIIKAHQDTRSTMWAGIWSNVLNLALNTFFLFVLEWGVFGIAFSTVLGRLAGLVYALARARYHERRRQREWEEEGGVNEDSDPRPTRAVLALAVPGALSFALMSAETGIVNRILAGLEHATEAIAAYSIYYRIVLFALNPVIAIGVAMLPYAARRFGAGDMAGIYRSLRESFLTAVAFSVLLVAPLCFVFARSIATWLGESPLTVEYATFSLKIVPFACLAGTPFLIGRPIFEGMQRGRPGLVMAVLRYGVLAAPLAWGAGVLAESRGIPGIFGVLIGLLAAATVSSVVFLVWLFAALRRRARLDALPDAGQSGA